MPASLNDRLAVCSWSLQPTSPTELFERLQAVGLRRIQCALDPLRESPGSWARFGELCAANQVTLVSGMFGTVGEDYSTLDTIRRTGGVVPDATWEANRKNIQSSAQLARQLGLKLVTFHAGFLPHDPGDPDFKKLQGRLQVVADLFAAQNLEIAFETGQETADCLRAFLEQLDRRNVGVNFDPANMILYDKGDPIEAVRVLGPWVRQVHLKDATRTQQPGTWGEEVPVGTGEVDWRAFFAALDEIGFTGNCCIEREAGTQRVQDIQTARQLVEAMG